MSVEESRASGAQVFYGVIRVWGRLSNAHGGHVDSSHYSHFDLPRLLFVLRAASLRWINTKLYVLSSSPGQWCRTCAQAFGLRQEAWPRVRVYPLKKLTHSETFTCFPLLDLDPHVMRNVVSTFLRGSAWPDSQPGNLAYRLSNTNSSTVIWQLIIPSYFEVCHFCYRSTSSV